jgi:hypothetical protein
LASEEAPGGKSDIKRTYIITARPKGRAVFVFAASAAPFAFGVAKKTC